MLALCLTEQQQFPAALEEARQAVHLCPDVPFSHYVLARVAYHRNDYRAALGAIQEAIRLDPTDPDHFSLLAAVHFEERRWAEALAAADQGLRQDPEHVGCANLRAMALVKLGRRSEAGVAIEGALAKAPESSITHANQGWTLVERGEYAKALEHFREALRLDPQNEWARQGIVEALQARHLIYAVMLRYFLWMSRLSQQAQWGIVIGGYVGYRVLGTVAKANPALAPWILPVQILYVVFALMTWLAQPLFNLVLRLNRFGRLALSREQVVASNWVGACLLLALACVAGFLASGFERVFLLAALIFGLQALPTSAVFKCEPGWPRRAMLLYAVGMGGLGVTAAALLLAGAWAADDARAATLGRFAGPPLGLFLLGVFVSGFLANYLIGQRPKR